MPELSKNYVPQEVEERWYQRWLDDKCFQADPSRVSEKRPAYSIVIPPPNVTGVLHMGHILNNTIQDILSRRARMQGKEVLWLPGTDHAGIATQSVVEKTLRKQGVIKHRDDLGREKLVEKIWEWKEKHGGIILQQLKRLGASCDWSRERFTMDANYSRCVTSVFVDLYKKGLIYRGKRMVNWCPSSLTALSDEEVIMKEQRGSMYYFQVEVIDDDSTKTARPRAVDITTEQEDNARHEFTQTNPRTRLPTFITDRRFDERAGPGLTAANRNRVGQARALHRELAGGGAADADGARSLTIEAVAARHGIPLVRLPDLGLVMDADGVSRSSSDEFVRLKAGSEAQPFLDKPGGTVLKIFAQTEDCGIGKKLRATRDADGRWFVDFESATFIETLEKLNLLHEIGGLPTEIVGITPQAGWIVAQPEATHVPIEEFPAARAEAVANVGGIQVADVRGLENIRIVWHHNQAWMIGDLHAKNIMRDADGRALIMDALTAPVPKAMLELPAVRQAIVEAKEKAGALSTATHSQGELSLFSSTSRKTLLTIATTRPETIPGDSAVAVNPKDPRYSHLIGKQVRRALPLENQAAIPIIGDEHVDFEFGTGVLKVTPAHDKADFEIGQRHDLQIIDVLHPNGILNEHAGKDLAGMERFEGRKKAVELLIESGALVKEEPHQNNVGYSERADVPVEPRLSEQWFLRYPSQQAAHDVVTRGEMRFFPDRWAKVYDHWMGGLQDWCISRQLWWGHRIPVWHKRVTINDYQLDADVFGWSGLDCSPEANEKAGRVVRCIRVRDSMEVNPEDYSFRTSETKNDQDTFDVFVATADEEKGRELEKFGFAHDPDVLDTWFSSWLWPFATMGWPAKTADLKAFYPTTDLVTGPDIIFFWVARMIMAGYEYMGELPFKNVYFTGIIRDKQGRKMSKSLGNSPDPLDLIASYSADALRLGIMRGAPLGQDILFDEKNVELGRNFCTKLWNAARFRQMQDRNEGDSPSAVEGEIDPALLSSDDKWILLRLNAAITEVSTALDEYRFSDATSTLYRFFWSEYCDWYVEASKATLSNSRGNEAQTVESTAESESLQTPAATDQAAKDAMIAEGGMSLPSLSDSRKANTLAVIDFVLGHTLRLFHPFLPFITEELWQGMGFHDDLPADQGGRSIMFAPWPKPLNADELAHFGILPEDEKTANDKYETVNLGRGLKSAFNINKKVRFVLRPKSELPAHEIQVLRILLNAEPLDVDAAFQPTKGTPSAITPLGDLFLPLDGIIDVAAESERVKKEMTKVESELAKVRAKLADENFTSKVPQKVLDDHTQREADWSAQLAKLKTMLDALG